MKPPARPTSQLSNLYCGLSTGLFFFIFSLNVLALGFQLRTIFPSAVPERTYTYEGHDYPRALPLDLGDPVALTIRDFDRYDVAGQNGSADWSTILPPGAGFIHLGPKQRRFALSMFHQLHCLDMIRMAVSSGKFGGHIHHCFNYIRQTVLCASDLTLEEGVPELGIDPTGELGVNGLGMTHTCRDWSKVYAHVTAEDARWHEWRKSHDIISY